jgi:hypothetical protein
MRDLGARQNQIVSHLVIPLSTQHKLTVRSWTGSAERFAQSWALTQGAPVPTSPTGAGAVAAANYRKTNPAFPAAGQAPIATPAQVKDTDVPKPPSPGSGCAPKVELQSALRNESYGNHPRVA